MNKSKTRQQKDEILIQIENLGINGEGIGKLDGKTVFVKGGLVGETVKIKVIHEKPSFLVGKLIEVVTPSKDRREPKCEVYGKCGGCSLQHLDYGEQLKYKQRTVKETLKKVAGLEVEVDQTQASDKEYGYRNKISLPIRTQKGGVKTGFFRTFSHDIVEFSYCPLQKPEINKTVSLMREFLNEYGGKPYDETDGSGDIRHLVVRSVCDKLYVTVVVNERVNLKGFEEKLRRNFNRYALYINYNNKNNNVILGERTEFLGGDDKPIELNGLLTDVHPAGFFQVNDYIRDRIYDFVLSKITTNRVIDAYSGAGLMTARLAKRAKEVFGIEINPFAHQSALEFKARNGIDNMFPKNADSGKALKELLTKDCTVILDPPRTGCGEDVITALKDFEGEIIYISCNPATLSRDLKLLNKKIKSITPFDMFPQTSNVETVAVLSGESKEN